MVNDTHRLLGAYSVEKLGDEENASKTWGVVLMVGRIAHVVCKMALSRDGFPTDLPLRPKRWVFQQHKALHRHSVRPPYGRRLRRCSIVLGPKQKSVGRAVVTHTASTNRFIQGSCSTGWQANRRNPTDNQAHWPRSATGEHLLTSLWKLNVCTRTPRDEFQVRQILNPFPLGNKLNARNQSGEVCCNMFLHVFLRALLREAII